MITRKRKELIPPGLLYIADNIVSKHNILGTPGEEKARWAKELKLPGRGSTVFFSGCGYQFSGSLESMMSLMRKTDKSVVGADLAMNVAAFQKKLGIDAAGLYRKLVVRDSGADARPLKAAVKALGKLGVELAYLAEDEPCCGAPLHFAGLKPEFAQNARETYQKLKSYGVKRIVSIVPSCTYALRTLITGCVDGYDIEVKHFTEAVLENMSCKEMRFPREVKVTYHDPCQLGRYLGLIDEPRQILRSIKGIDLVETEWTKGEWATCCGGGGGFEAVFPELSGILAANRTRELLQTGAQIIVTNCPGCILQLKEGLKELKAENVEILDLAEVVAMSLEV